MALSGEGVAVAYFGLGRTFCAVAVGIWLAEWSKGCAKFVLSELDHTASLLENPNLTIFALLPYITPSSTDHFMEFMQSKSVQEREGARFHPTWGNHRSR